MAAANLTLVCETCGREFTRDRQRNRRAFCGYFCSNFRNSWRDRFWAKVNKNCPHGCWLWTRGKMRGHGWFDLASVGPMLAHRISWLLLVGSIPKGFELMHLCDVNYAPGDSTYRACINPAHMATASHSENMAWMKTHDRAADGDRNGVSKISEIDLVSLFRFMASGATNDEAMARSGLARTTIRNLRSGQRRGRILAKIMGHETYEALRQKAVAGAKA